MGRHHSSNHSRARPGAFGRLASVAVSRPLAEPRNPLRLSRDRTWLYAVVCIVVTSLPFILQPSWFHDVASWGDFAVFRSAGANVGSTTLIEPSSFNVWKVSHHLGRQPFLYLPAFAWVYAPLSRLPPMNGLLIEETASVALFLIAALIAASAYRFTPWFAIAAVFAWGPTVNSIESGQNTGIALVLAFTTVWAIVNRHLGLAGFAVGLSMYKPTIAIPFLLMLAVRREWKALGVAAICAAGWYLLSVGATHGDWAWPITYARVTSRWFAIDFPGSAFKAYSIPTILVNVGVGQSAAFAVGAVLLLFSMPFIARAPALQAVSIMPLIGLATSAHAWPYDAALALPAICYAMTSLREPWRTRIAAATYPLVAVALITHWGAWALATVVIGGAGAWIASAMRTPRRLPA